MSIDNREITQHESFDAPPTERPQWRRPEISILDVEIGTASGSGAHTDGLYSSG